jgi:myo-inositol-1-phosphate synthase
MDNGLKGELTAPSAYFMKTPPVQYADDEAHRMVEDFIKATAHPETVAKKPQKQEAAR